MKRFSSLGSASPPLTAWLAACFVALCCSAYSQNYYPNQEVRISDLPSLTAPSKDPADVLATSLEIVLHNKEVCCAKNSALEDAVQSADPASLKDISTKLQGRHLLSDGRPIIVTADYFAPASINSGNLISSLMKQQLPLMEWNSHLYVVYGVIYDKTLDYSSGARMDAIRKFLLLDTRFSNSQRLVSFNRETDDLSKVQGILLLTVAPQ